MAVIRISGKIGSGKDTVGRIIRLLAEGPEPLGMSAILIGIEDPYFYHQTVCDWKIKKFAGKLKQIVSILTGIPVEELEKEEVKNKELGEEWRQWFVRQYKFSNNDNPLGKVSGIFASKEEAEEKRDSLALLWQLPAYALEVTSHLPNVRWLLQNLGTQSLRDVIHPNVHINALFADYKAKGVDKNNVIWSKDGDMEVGLVAHEFFCDELWPKWIITDMGFPNELKSVADRRVITIRVNRGAKREPLKAGIIPTLIDAAAHESETALDNATFDHTIDNNGTIEELVEKVRAILIEEKII